MSWVSGLGVPVCCVCSVMDGCVMGIWVGGAHVVRVCSVMDVCV